jgi:protein TonB
MEKNDRYFFIGGFVSVFIYGLLLWFILSYIAKSEIKSKQYTSKKNSFIEISIKEKKNVKRRSKILKSKPKKKISKKKKVLKKKAPKTKVRKTAKRTVKSKSLKSLFSGINTKKYLKKEENLTKKANQNSRIPKYTKKSIPEEIPEKQKTATSIVKSLSLETASMPKSQKSGEYNEYIGKISDMLDSKWQETPGTLPGNTAKVTVTIDKFGNFSYKIDELSYNNEFNAKLESFLESLKDEKFPPYKLGDFITIKVNFKDE